MADPVVKWAGGKRRLTDDLRARMPSTFGRYFEPFCGGAALFFALEPTRAVLGDANADLIAMYKAIAEAPDFVAFILANHVRLHSETHYLATRRMWNSNEFFSDERMAAAAFLYLNRACYNGLWRVNRKGEFNVPMDATRETLSFNYENLSAASVVLQRADLRTGDFRDTLVDAQRGDFVYLDPPYVPVTKTANFTAYAAGGFGPEQQRVLADLVRALVDRGVYVLVSNSDTPLVRELYSGMRIDTVQCDRRVNSRANGRGKVGEVIVVGEPSKCVYRSAARRARKLAAAAPEQQLSFAGVLATPHPGIP